MEHILAAKRYRAPYALVGLLAWLLIGLAVPGRASAHAMLLEAQPSPGAHLDRSPTRISLKFSERLEQGLYHLQVLGEEGRPVSAQPALLSDNRQQLNLDLPEMPDGVFTVTYRILSTDGHPISGSYTFAVGDISLMQVDGGGLSSSHGSSISEAGEMHPASLLLYTIRALYMASMLCLTGWMLWVKLLDTDARDLQSYRMRWLRIQQRCFLLLLSATIAVQFTQTLLIGAGLNLAAILMTVQGVSWLASLSFAMASCLLYRRSAWAGLAGMTLVIMAESCNGHAAAIAPGRAIALEGVHLLAAAVWAGGLLYLVAHYRKFKEHAVAFLPKFSAAALTSLVALVVTGAAVGVLYLPKLEYVTASSWGRLLLLKTGCVLFVMLTGAFLRSRIKRGRAGSVGGLLKIDVSLMLMIMGIVGVFTTLSPTPANRPFQWEVTDHPAIIMAEMTPFAVGVNRVQVQAGLPENPEMSTAPKSIRMWLRYADSDNDMTAPMEVPLTPSSRMFANDAVYIPFAGTWEVEIRIMDVDDEETVYRKSQTIY